MEDRADDEANANANPNSDQPIWAKPGDQPEPAWRQSPPPPPGAELEPGEQANSTVAEEQRTGEVTGYNMQGPSARDVEMGAESSPGSQEGTATAEQARQGADGAQSSDFASRWQSVQAAFVDDPRQAVEQADQFFEDVVAKLHQERERLRGEWQASSSTEDLRVAMQRYRDYFRRWLS